MIRGGGVLSRSLGRQVSDLGLGRGRKRILFGRWPARMPCTPDSLPNTVHYWVTVYAESEYVTCSSIRRLFRFLNRNKLGATSEKVHVLVDEHISLRVLGRKECSVGDGDGIFG